MNLLKRARNIWNLAEVEDLQQIARAYTKRKEKAVFLTETRVEDILQGKPNASIDDVLV